MSRKIWGFHMPDALGREALAGGFIAFDNNKLPDLSKIKVDRDAFKQATLEAYEHLKPGAVPVYAGVSYRFAREMTEGDVVVYPAKSERTIHFGVIVGDYRYVIGETPHRRSVTWKKQKSRDDFSQSALYEIGSAITLFSVKRHAEEFLAALDGRQLPTSVEDDQSDQDDEAVIEAVTSRATESTKDFVLRRLKSEISPYEFEHFVADLFVAMGFFARATQGSVDGGVDVIAHRDELGLEPPIIKIQCKQKTEKIGRPDVQQLHGAIEGGECGLFLTLGGYTPDARTYERSKPNLKLVDGDELVEIIFRHYSSFSPRLQQIVPLVRVYLPSVGDR